ncbi:MAG: nucleotidyltransferase domain-containing protein [Sedimentisphaerales bacterium]|nr:nucleotidyltransferase domain-containing protein [Sedimentisphaerales bacterium]
MDQNEIPKEKIAAFCRSHHIRKLGFFGSVLSKGFSGAGDIDVLVEFEPGHTPGWDFFLMQEELSHLLARPVDLNTPGFLSRYFRERAMEDEVIVYDQ